MTPNIVCRHYFEDLGNFDPLFLNDLAKVVVFDEAAFEKPGDITGLEAWMSHLVAKYNWEVMLAPRFVVLQTEGKLGNILQELADSGAYSAKAAIHITSVPVEYEPDREDLEVVDSHSPCPWDD